MRTLFLSLMLASGATMAEPVADPHLWLEDVTGDASLAWVREQNAVSVAELAESAGFKQLEGEILSILDSDRKIPLVERIGDHYYNLWKDKDHARGLWRRTTLAEYRKDDPAWETVIDLDALGRAEGENWVWHGADCLRPQYRRCLVSLSRGGADADVVREFDLQTKSFVQDGFHVPEARNMVSWLDADTLYVGTDVGPGSMTASGYPRTVRVWKRGTALEDAPTVFEGRPEDVGVYATRDHAPGFERDFYNRYITFFTTEMQVLRDGVPVRVDKPDSANATVHREWLYLDLREDWTVGGRTYAAGSLLAARFDAFMAGERDFDVLFEPTARTSLAGYTPLRSRLVLNVLDNVRSRLYVLTPGRRGWTREALPGVPELGSVSASAVDADVSDEYFLTVTDFLTPTTLALGTAGKGAAEPLKRLPDFFDASGLAASQHEATSKDGTRVPYFLVGPGDLRLDGRNPTLLYGYGGFEVAELPVYSGAIGKGWLERGGVYVIANIRGGGEFGPRWHQAALKANRHKAYEDFAAVAQDLVARKVTDVPHLGAQGGSNGGLLIGNMLTTWPHLFGALVCQVPLLDMQRYSKLLAGASWVDEYGDPDQPGEWAFLQKYSPYHNLRKDVRYPRTLFTTSTRDDRVHPGHARKMVARMREQGHDVLYYENIEGGHGGAADNRQKAFMSALAYEFLWRELAPASGVDVVELGVRSAQEGLRARRFTARQLAEASLARIAAYDPGYNAIITPNPDALREADAVDRRRAAGEALGPLAGIPVVVKDTIDMAGLPTTAGWAPLSSRAGGIDLLPENDAPVVARLRAAGAVILGKTNVPVFSGSADNANDSWAGPTYNVVAPARAPGGSSTGTATAVAASFAVLGLAEETGGSIQCPAANQALVGIKPTFGLVPNTGVVPLAGSTRDVIGPIARTVQDAAIALDAIAGYTPADPKTVAAIGKVPAGGYSAGLDSATLAGKRIGTWGPGWLATPLTDDARHLYAGVLDTLRSQGAVLVDDPFAGSDFASIARPMGSWRYDARGQESVVFDLQSYFAALGKDAPIRSVAELVQRTGQDPFSRKGVLGYMHDYPAYVASLAAPNRPPDLGDFLQARERYLKTFDAVMDRHRLDALVFPQTLAEPLPLHSTEFNDLPTVSQINIGGFPAITVPAGLYPSGTPFAALFVGRLWDEAALIRLAHAYEQRTRVRRAPELVRDPATLRE